MVAQLLEFVEANRLLRPGDRALLATSGGVDSVVLCHLFRQAGLPFAIAHCNFQLRGPESDSDEAFVKQLADKLQVPYFSTRFATREFAANQHCGIQEAARNLRYGWLEEIRQTAGYQVIATAHHLDDSVETALFNFAKGCGIRGLHGILPKRGFIIRPLLFATKKQIVMYAERENIQFREDASNLTSKYSRNLIRQQAIPVLEQINPRFQQSAGETLERLWQTEQLLDVLLETIRNETMEKTSDGWRIDLTRIRRYPALPTVLYELISPFGFNNDQVAQMLDSMEGQPGKVFHSPSWRLLVDRSFLIISGEEKLGGVYNIPAIPTAPISLPEGKMTFSVAPKPVHFTSDPHQTWMDLDKLSFPLRLRHWQAGDVFSPLGMGGHHQKLQDFFTHQKLSLFDKEKVWLLESGGSICWVVGMRLDERFKVTEETKNCLHVQWEPANFAANADDGI